MQITLSGGNTGIVPPWITHPIHIWPHPYPIAPMRRDYHVVPHGQMWAVIRENDAYASAIKLTKAEAVGYGIEQARASYVSLITHRKDGTIQSVWSYDNATFPD